MSGFLQGAYYALFLDRPVTLRMPARRLDTAPGQKQEWLERARPALDAYFERLARAPDLPLARFGDGEHEEIAGAISDDLQPVGAGDEEPSTDEVHFRTHHQGGPVLVRLRGSDLLPGHESLELCLLVTGRVGRSRVEPILREVASLVAAAQHLPPPAPPPPPRRSLWERLLRWVRRPEAPRG
jgi:hypothetical protein